MIATTDKDFTKTDAYAKEGWACYLRLRAQELQKQGWIEAQDATPGNRKFTTIQPLYEIEFGTPGYNFFETTFGTIEDAPFSMFGNTPYDAWGRQDFILVPRSNGTSKYVMDMPARDLDGSPIEGILAETDSKNYHLFLNAYLQGIRKEMGKLGEYFRTTDFKLTDYYCNFPTLILNNGEKSEQELYFNKSNIVFHPFNNSATENSTILARIENSDDPKQTEALLKNDISDYETMRLELFKQDSALYKNVDEICGPKTRWWQKGHKNEGMFQTWQDLRNFSPAVS